MPTQYQMEAIAAFGLVGLGYLVTKLSETKENFQPLLINNSAPASVSPLQRNEQGNSVKAPNQELDLQYATPFGQIYPSEPVPGPKGSAFAYGGVREPASRTYPTPQPIDTATPQVSMNRGGLEQNPTYIEDDSGISSLTFGVNA